MKADKPFISRREFLKLLGYFSLTGAAALMGGLEYAARVEPGWLDITNLPLRLRRLSPAFSGFRIAQISDIHMGGWMNRERLDKVVQAALEQSPDVIAITGDFLLGRGWDEDRQDALEELSAGLKPLSDSISTLAVMGNHDYWTDPKKIRQRLRGLGIKVLSNSVHSLRRGNEFLHICGMDDVYEGRDRMDQLLSRLPDEGAAVLLCHEPDYADTSAATGRFDLQISGHSHGGQVIIPFMGPIRTPQHGRKYPLGLCQVQNMWEYTNRGVGMARLPLRFNCRPEITVYTLASEAG